jgi:hypothetical protein
MSPQPVADRRRRSRSALTDPDCRSALGPLRESGKACQRESNALHRPSGFSRRQWAALGCRCSATPLTGVAGHRCVSGRSRWWDWWSAEWLVVLGGIEGVVDRDRGLGRRGLRSCQVGVFGSATAGPLGAYLLLDARVRRDLARRRGSRRANAARPLAPQLVGQRKYRRVAGGRIGTSPDVASVSSSYRRLVRAHTERWRTS